MSRGRWIAGGALVLVVGVAAVALPRLRSMASVGAGYVAKQACSCLFVAERSEARCRADLRPDIAERVGFALTPDGTGVRARASFLASRVARHHPGRGCTLQP